MLERQFRLQASRLLLQASPQFLIPRASGLVPETISSQFLK